MYTSERKDAATQPKLISGIGMKWKLCVFLVCALLISCGKLASVSQRAANTETFVQGNVTDIVYENPITPAVALDRVVSIALNLANAGIREMPLPGENPRTSNRGPFVDVFQTAVNLESNLRDGSGRVAHKPWCVFFVQWIILQVEKSGQIKSKIPGRRSTLTMLEEVKKTHQSIFVPFDSPDSKMPKPGWLVLYKKKLSFAAENYESYKFEPGHTEIVVSVFSDGKISSVGGNTLDFELSDKNSDLSEGEGIVLHQEYKPSSFGNRKETPGEFKYDWLGYLKTF